MRYEVAIERLFALQARGMRMGIERMRDALAVRAIADPGFPVIQVAGTNGKGSVSAMIALGLSSAGYRTGLFTSPHLHRFTERVQIDGQPLGTRETARRIRELLEQFQAPGAPEVSFFELSTLLAVEAFRDHGCDVAVIEVGLGGRLDATTALPAHLSVITNIGLDHTHMLGNSLGQIAGEKAGIVRAGVRVVVGSRKPEAQQVILARARELAAPVDLIARDFRVLAHGQHGSARVVFQFGRERSAALRLGLSGEHQHDNAAVAFAALVRARELGFSIPLRAIERALTRVRWPARLEQLPGRPRVLMDAAHNPDGCRALAEFLVRQKQRPRVLIFGAVADKDYPQMLRLLAPAVETIIYAKPSVPRALPPAELMQLLPGVESPSPAAALRTAKRAAGSSGLVVIAGSIFLVAELRARLLGLPVDPLIRM